MPLIISDVLIDSLFQAKYRERARIAHLILQKIVRSKAAGTYGDHEHQLTWMLAESYRPLLQTLAHQFQANGSLDDAVSIGIQTLQQEFDSTDLTDSTGEYLDNPQQYFLKKARWRMQDYLKGERRVKKKEVPLDVTPEKGIPDLIGAESKELVGMIWDAIDALPPRQRELIHLVYDRDDPGMRTNGDEIAAKLGIPRGTLDSQLHRAKERLYKLLSAYPTFAEQLR